MRFPHVAAIVGCAAVGLETAAEAPSWYVIASLGHGQKCGMDQVGSNRDTTCYPTDACFLETPIPSVPGYRWRYAIDLDAGSGFEVGVGRETGKWRFELAATSSRHDVTQTFTGIEYLDGSPIPPGDGSVDVDIEASIDHVRTASISLAVLRKASIGRANVYFGAGAGVAAILVRDVRFRAAYCPDCIYPAVVDPSNRYLYLYRYDSRQDDDLNDAAGTVLAHVGADYPLTERLSLGGRLTYSHVGDIADQGPYLDHPMHEEDSRFSSVNTFDAANGWRLAATVRYRFRHR